MERVWGPKPHSGKHLAGQLMIKKTIIIRDVFSCGIDYYSIWHLLYIIIRTQDYWKVCFSCTRNLRVGTRPWRKARKNRLSILRYGKISQDRFQNGQDGRMMSPLNIISPRTWRAATLPRYRSLHAYPGAELR